MIVRICGVALLLLLLIACAHEFTGTVVTVNDGDTLVVNSRGTETKIRLFGVDAPELHQPFGREAHEFMKRLTLSKAVRIRQVDTDSHDRTVAYVYLQNGRSVNEELIAAGYAWWFRKYAPDVQRFKELEQEARVARRGLWHDPKPIEPWNFRNGSGRPRSSDYRQENASVVITHLHCNGSGETEPDEYVEIQNRLGTHLDLTGWTLHDNGSKHTFQFPENTRIGPNEKCRIYTNEDRGCFNMRVANSAVWNNSGDRAHLKDRSGLLIAARGCD